MNLAKKGAVLFTALSVFACTSCNNGVHTVTFDVNGGTPELGAVKVVHDQLMREPDFKPVLNGNELVYWSLDDEDVEKPAPFDFNTPITSNVTLHAIYSVEITYEEAQAWLDAHYTSSDEHYVQSGDFSWDYSESVADPDQPGQFFEFGLPFLVSYLINEQSIVTGPIKGTEEKTVSDFHYEGYMSTWFSEKTGNMLKKYIKEYTKEGEDPKPIKCWLEGDGLHVSYKRHEDLMGLTSIDLIETDVYGTNCCANKFSVALDKTKIDFPGYTQFGIPAFKGELTGFIDGFCNLSEYDDAHKWVSTHYDPTGVQQRTIETQDCVWDFSACEDDATKTFVLTTLSTLLGKSVTSLKGEEKGLTPTQATMPVLTVNAFESQYEEQHNAIFEMSDDEMIASYAATVPAGPLQGFYITMETAFDTNCFRSSETMIADHSTSTEQPGVNVTGYLTMSYNFASE